MKKRDQKYEDKDLSKAKQTPNEPLESSSDFMSFKDIDPKYSTDKQIHLKDGDEIVTREPTPQKSVANKLYPWLSPETSKIEDIFLFLHNEILDFTKFM
jgi:hypothetical protein